MNNKLDILLGLQWGNEGKGKIADILTTQYKLVARFQGGPNAGHSVEAYGKKYVLHNIPSGIFREGTVNIIGNNVVFDPVSFKEEIESLIQDIPNVKQRIIISSRANLILPTHKMIDAMQEDAKGSEKIGTSKKGIGPAYVDKWNRTALKIVDAFQDNFPEKYNKLINAHAKYIKTLSDGIDAAAFQAKLDAKTEEFLKAIEFLKDFQVGDTDYIINTLLDNNERVLAEGAQGTMLDNDFGIYPYVTASTTVASGACTGLGVPPQKIGDVYGVFKSYCTRNGEGPFPTELTDRDGKIMQVMGNEYDEESGKDRRCGWLDLVALKYACMINGVTKLIMTKCDVLDSFKKLNVCIGYKTSDDSNEIIVAFPSLNTAECKPYYAELSGWNQDISEIKEYDKLPQAFKEFVGYIEYFIGIPIVLISVGSGREDVVKNTSHVAQPVKEGKKAAKRAPRKKKEDK